MACEARYLRFARNEAAGRSPRYEMLAQSIAGDREVCGLIETLPEHKWQPNLLFAATQYLDGPTSSWAQFHRFVTRNWTAIAAVMRARSTQTNEVARCGTLLPILASLEGPLSLIEVGASAGLCLYPDRYQYSYDGVEVGPVSPVRLEVRCEGEVPVPASLPEVAWRVGLDLNPLNVRKPADLAWLRACVWPEHHHRRQRLDAAAALVSDDPPHLITGNLTEATTALVEQAPPHTTKVVFHSAVLAYVSPPDREAFAASMARDDIVWISNEAPGVVDGLVTKARPPSFAKATSYFLAGIDQSNVVALADPHGSWLSWISPG